MKLRLSWSTIIVAAVLTGLVVRNVDWLAGWVQNCSGSYCVAVTPDGGYEPSRDQNSSSHTATLVVANTGSVTVTFGFECHGSGGVSCDGTDIGSKKLFPGGSTNVVLTYSVGTSGGNLVLTASGGPVSDTGYRVITTPPNLNLVMPVVTSADTALVHTRRPLILATYSVNDAAIDTTSLVVKFGTDTVTTLARWNSRLVEWEVDASRELTPGTAKDLTIKICNVAAGCTTKTWKVLLDNSGPPVVSFTGMPLEAHGSHFGSSFGPGISVSGAEVETGFSVPAYTSMGAQRSVGFVYSTRQSYPRALVNADIELTWPAGTPDQIKAVLIDGSTRMDSLTVASPNCSGGGGRRCRVTLQGDFSGTTGIVAQRKWLKVEVQVTSGATTKTTVDSTEVVLVDRRSSRFGRGWYPSGVLMRYSVGSDVIVVGPTGAATIYRGSDGKYLSPPGDPNVLVGSELKARDGSRLVFDGSGRLSSIVDRHQNYTNLTWGTLDSLIQITDPIGHTYKLVYASGSVTVIDTMPGQSSARFSRLTISGGDVTYDSVASPTIRPATTTYSYTGVGSNSANVLASRTDALGQTTTISYDGRNRPTQATLPAVLPETGGSTQSPVITYRAQELRGLDTLLSADSIFVQVKDPLGNWTRSVLNRWASSERTWDAVGTVSRASYNAGGSVAWQEGKVADSTRVHFSYDAQGRQVRTYRYRAAGDVVQFDTALFDGAHNVIRRKNALGLRDSATFNSYHDVLTSHAPSGDVTAYQWQANGLLDWVDPPGATGRTSYTYHTSWKNVEQVVSAGATVALNTYDAFGRVTETRRRVLVRRTNAGITFQWRRTVTWYSELNQVDSVWMQRTADCASPCSSPGTWLTGTDMMVTRNYFDRLGRDTARVGSSGQGRTRYVYDALARVRMRYPYAESTAIVDSFRYDLAGNVRYQWTRRGTQIEHRYDSRNRDTLAVVPGIGDIRRAYGGPNDEITRAWVTYCGGCDSLVIEPEMRWGYSQAGLLRADTAQGTRVTNYHLDRYGRDSVTTDVTGSWSMRYDVGRAMLDSVFTPFGDTLRWSIDSLWRSIGPYVSNGSDPDFASVQLFDSTRKVVAVRDTHVVNVGWWRASDSSQADVEMNPFWTETRGSGGATVTMYDSLIRDGWGRISVMTYLRDGTSERSDSFAFDNDGNILPSNESRNYDRGTRRLRSLAGGVDQYSYDRAGNLVKDSTLGSVWTYGYDPLNRLTAVRNNGTLIARYGYDVQGRRIAKRVYNAGPLSGSVGFTRMIYRDGNVVAETDSAGNLTFAYTWALGADNLIGIHKYGTGSGDWYVSTDVLRSVRGLSKRDGTWAASWRYRIYGLVAHESAGSAPFEVRYRWTGREYDIESGWYYHRTRYYSPSQMRFVQEDIAGYAGGDNLFAYGDGDPTTGRDPDGMKKNNDIQVAPVDMFGWDASCIGTTVGCGGGGGWRRDEMWVGMGFNILTPFEQNELFDTYQSNARDLLRNIRNNPEALPPEAQVLLNARLEAMDRFEFTYAYNAIDSRMSGPDKTSLLQDFFITGNLIVEREGAGGTYAATVPLSNPGEHRRALRVAHFAVINETVLRADVNPSYAAHLIVHEWLHTKGYPEGNRINCATFSRVPSSRGVVNLSCR